MPTRWFLVLAVVAALLPASLARASYRCSKHGTPDLSPPRGEVPPNPTFYLAFYPSSYSPDIALREVRAEVDGARVPVWFDKVRDDSTVVYRIRVDHPRSGALKLTVVDTDDGRDSKHEYDLHITPRWAEANEWSTRSNDLDGVRVDRLCEDALVVSVEATAPAYRVEWDEVDDDDDDAPSPRSVVVPAYRHVVFSGPPTAAVTLGGFSRTEPAGPRCAGANLELDALRNLRIVALLPDGREIASPVVDGGRIVAGMRAARPGPDDPPAGEPSAAAAGPDTTAASDAARSDAALRATAAGMPWTAGELLWFYVGGFGLGLLGALAWLVRRRRQAATT